MGTNHSPTDSKYYSTDVLYIEDHGAWAVNLTTVSNGKADLLSDYHEIPPGANESLSCTPFVYGYKVSKLAATRAQADKNGLGGAEGAPLDGAGLWGSG